MRAAAIVPAAGRGVRMRSDRPKAVLTLMGRSLIAWTLESILDLQVFSEILIACPSDDIEAIEHILREEANGDNRVRFVKGGETRQESVANCLDETSGNCDLVAVHDAARPMLTSQLMMDVLNRANETGAAIAAVPCKDTVKLCNEHDIVESTLDRSRLWLVQTPQCFRRDLLVSAHKKAADEGHLATDDAALVERFGAPVHVVMGSYENIKVTTPEDISICEEILRGREV